MKPQNHREKKKTADVCVATGKDSHSPIPFTLSLSHKERACASLSLHSVTDWSHIAQAR